MNKKTIIKTFIIFLLVILIGNVCYGATMDQGIFAPSKEGRDKIIDGIKKDTSKDTGSFSESTDGTSSSTTTGITDPTKNPEAYTPGIAESSKIKKVLGPILGAIRNVGVVVAVIILMVIGVKYMLGSVEEKANYKQTLFPYLIGAIILFMGSIIPEIIYNTMK